MPSKPPEFSPKYLKQVKKRLKKAGPFKSLIKFPAQSYKTGQIDPRSLVVKG